MFTQDCPNQVNAKIKQVGTREGEIQLLIPSGAHLGVPPDGRVYCPRATLQLSQREPQPGINSRQTDK